MTKSQINPEGKIFVFSAPSGAGKNTLINFVRKAIPEMVYSISATTRSPRVGEVAGRDYFFLTEEEFRRRIREGGFAEWALVHGHYYGTPRNPINATILAGRHVIMDIDVVGKIKFDNAYPRAIGILILPPSLEVLENRLRARGSDDEKTIQLRMINARREIEFAKTQGKYEYTIVNDDLAAAENETLTLIRSLASRADT